MLAGASRSCPRRPAPSDVQERGDPADDGAGRTEEGADGRDERLGIGWVRNRASEVRREQQQDQDARNRAYEPEPRATACRWPQQRRGAEHGEDDNETTDDRHECAGLGVLRRLRQDQDEQEEQKDRHDDGETGSHH